MKIIRKYHLPILVFFLTTIILGMVQWKVDNPMILIERFIPGSGWGMVLILGIYAGFLISKMKDPAQSATWRKRSWTLFSIVFFGQLMLGLSGFEKFLMNPDKLHFPIPALIVAGPVYRGHISFMTILFISTVILAGPAWCSQLCYFGAIDNLVSSTAGKPVKKPISYKYLLKNTVLLIVVASALLLRLLKVELYLVATIAAIFGLAGLMVMLILSVNQKKMIHCTIFCPVGTVIRFARLINPFRMHIDTNCTECMACTKTCYYDALNIKDIQRKKPAATCTLCGDCVTSCHTSSIHYKFLGLNPEQARNLWLVITITLHAVFLGLARL